MSAPNRKIIAQIKTGEGKSALLAIMTAFQALTTGKKQYNVTTADYLAVRDVEKFASFYKKLGLSCTANVSTDPAEGRLHASPESYLGHIVYGTAASFQFGYMLSMFPESSAALSQAFKTEAIDIYIDEVDALVIDKEKSMSQISGRKKAKFTVAVYQHMVQYSMTTETEELSLNGLRAHLIQHNHFSETSINQKENLFLTHQWYQSLLTSKRLKKNEDYVVTINPNSNQPEVVIVDRKGTGALMHGSVWSSGLHQLISARENVPIEPESFVTASISQRSFFNLFASVFALTGTTGGKSCEGYFKAMYPGISILNMPRYRPSQAKMIQHVVSESQSAQFEQLITDIQQARDRGQPLLLLFETILETKNFQQYADSRGHSIDCLTGDDDSDVETILALAGLPGSVLAATFLAGRGADIMTTPEAEASGGLGVYVCTPPTNERVIWQNFGRTGRQGRQGFFAFRFNKEQLLSEIHALQRSMQRNSFHMQPDKLMLDIPQKSWEKVYQDPNLPTLHFDENDANPVTSPAKIVWPRKPTSSELHYMHRTVTPVDAGASPEQLIRTWVTLMNEAETLANQVSFRYSSYTDIIFEFQRFIYQLGRADLIDELPSHYNFLIYRLKASFDIPSLHAFEKVIGETLLTMAKDCDLSPEAIVEMASQNLVISTCLSRSQVTFEHYTHSLGFFAHQANAPAETSAVSASVPSPSGAGS